MDLNPHLSFDGECEAAFRYYAECLGGKIEMLMTYGASPLAGQTPTEWNARILHATLDLGAYRITGGDSFPGQYRKPAGVSVMLNIDEPVEADRIFTALAKGGEVEMPIQETFWALRHAHRPVRNSVRHQLRRAGRGMSVLATRRACHNKPSNHARSLIQDRSHSLRR